MGLKYALIQMTELNYVVNIDREYIMVLRGNIQISHKNLCNDKRESPSLAKGVRLRLLSLRGSWVQIPSPAFLPYFKKREDYDTLA
jgi:hypothetical protein